MQTSGPLTKREPVRLRLRVTAAAEAKVRSGHPWVFAQSIREQNRDGATGELAVIYDRKDRFLAAGLFDANSPIRVRVLVTGKPEEIGRDWFSGHLAEALAQRKGLFGPETNGFRCINGESDHWPGLVLDKYGGTLVLKLYTAAWLPHLHTLRSLLAEQLQPERLVLRLSRNVQATAATDPSAADGQLLAGPPVLAPVPFLENGITFEADVLRGQKTGFFLDQRENRAHVETLAKGRSVLNTFSFSGAFSIYAARGGARSVCDVDISAHALDAAKRNWALNQSCAKIAGCAHEAIQADVFEWLAGNTQKFDLVIVDPPSLAKREAERARAIAAYGRLASLGLQHLTPAGILVACSCSAHVTVDEFFETIRSSARRAGKMREIRTALHPPDHPAEFPEAHYLKAIYLARSGLK